MRESNLTSEKELSLWINKHSNELEKKYPGKWIAIKLPSGVVASGRLNQVISAWKSRFPNEKPFIELIPKKEESSYLLFYDF